MSNRSEGFDIRTFFCDVTTESVECFSKLEMCSGCDALHWRDASMKDQEIFAQPEIANGARRNFPLQVQAAACERGTPGSGKCRAGWHASRFAAGYNSRNP